MPRFRGRLSTDGVAAVEDTATCWSRSRRRRQRTQRTAARWSQHHSDECWTYLNCPKERRMLADINSAFLRCHRTPQCTSQACQTCASVGSNFTRLSRDRSVMISIASAETEERGTSCGPLRLQGGRTPVQVCAPPRLAVLRRLKEEDDRIWQSCRALACNVAP